MDEFRKGPKMIIQEAKLKVQMDEFRKVVK
jgi:hypothetical protein